MRKKIVLASASPRRKEILEQMGLSFTVIPAGGEENPVSREPAEMVKELALQKAEEVAASLKEPALVIGSDTVVACRGEILGKPADEAEAFRMLTLLQGGRHTVYTGVAAVDTEQGRILAHFASETEVSMYPMPEEWIWEYIRSGEPMDKAGAYAIQGGCALWIREIRGEYANVVGFPAARFYQELLKQGVDLKNSCVEKARETKTEAGEWKACIFDLDGTLCDSVESIASSANRALRELGMREASLKDYQLFVGDGVDMLVRRLLDFAGQPEENYFERLKALYLDYFREGCTYRVEPYPGIRELLEKLKKQGKKIGVLSNKPHENTEKVLDGIFGPGYFDCIQGCTEGIPRKPHPAGALKMAERLGAKPSECLYIGDTSTDMKTGISAGMYTVGVLWGFRGKEELEAAGADALAGEPLEILKLQNQES